MVDMTEVMTHAAARPRPKLEARRQAFLKAATAVFLEKGYAKATLDDVIARSGGSRQTLYVLFGGKQGLFEAITQDRCDKIFGVLNADSILDRPPDDVLVEFGVRLLETVTTPEALGLSRVVIAESASMPDLAEHFWTMGPGRSHALLAHYFERQVRRGVLRVQDPMRAAQQLWGMLLGGFHLHCLLGLRGTPRPDEIKTFVGAAVARFLDGCRADTGREK